MKFKGTGDISSKQSECDLRLISVSINDIFEATFFGLSPGEDFQIRIRQRYEESVTRILDRITEKLIKPADRLNQDRILEAVGKIGEKELLTTAAEAFQALFPPNFDVINHIKIDDMFGAFNGTLLCFSSSVILADVLTRMGRPVTVISVPGHVLIATQEYAFETTAKSSSAIKPKTSYLEQEYGNWQEDTVDKLVSIAWNNKGQIHSRLELYQLAIFGFKNAVEIDPKFAAAWNNMGLALGVLGRPEIAIWAFDKALEINPDYDKALANKGFELGVLQRNEEALEALDKALNINPKNVNAFADKLILLHELGRTIEIEEHLNDPNLLPQFRRQ